MKSKTTHHENRAAQPRTGRPLGWAWLLVLLALGLGAALQAPPALAAGFRIGNDDKHLKVSALLQGWGTLTPEGAPDGRSLSTELYLRRMRLLFYGQVTKWVHFFVETDSPNFGKNGDTSVNMFIQDAWVEFNIHEALQIDVGMVLAPFSHHGMQGAVSLHSLDYHAGLIKYPRGGHKVWRDWGVMVRGLLFKRHLGYRLALMNGVHGGNADPRNPADWPRLTGRLTVNVFESESGPGTGGFFWDGLYLKKTARGLVSPRRVLSFGVSMDWQRDLNVSRNVGESDPSLPSFVVSRDDYLAVAADAFLDLPLTRDRRWGLAGQLNFYYYDHGSRRNLTDGLSGSFYGLDGGSEYTGYGFLGEVGIRYDQWEVVANVDWFDATRADGSEGDLLSVYGGFNWWWRGHATNIKVQAGATKLGGGDFQPLVILQAQLLL